MNTDNMEPQMNTDEHRLNSITERIIGCCYTVANALGHGFLEKVYENALAHELRKNGLLVEQQKSLLVHYDGLVVGEYSVDLLVAGCVLVELRVAKQLDDVHLAQCLNYLRAAQLPLCLLVNYGTPKVQIRRIINSTYLRVSSADAEN